ncbi:MAG: hypothetical protein HN736_17850 [Anaerolineae bacterium]|jgi:hypothetical protein|nr:hypothetical protein [Anaerolineae bacterium]MBT7483768.1 hypothetical protein [Candidatus Peregrinibacteria bacterium]MBT3712668.1 hypothetical protein [Anaerolineae bacterium]MBT4310570.1 hypothetical protein [Anaerolineae bacterium]MBT4459868.1 hypothetical protein [Anaerolineae bacterium]
MKKLSPQSRTVLLTIIGAGFAFLSVAFGPIATTAQVATPTPDIIPITPDLDLDIGSTDGILVWAILIVLIIIIPILWNLFFLTKEK